MRTAFVAASLLALFTGCGDGLGVSPVTGTISLDGKPIAGATITFQPIEGGTGMPAVGRSDDSGTYTVTDMRAEEIGSGAAAGEYKVGVMWYEPGSTDTIAAEGSSDSTADARKAVGDKSLLPMAYQNANTSGLTASVKAGDPNIFDFDLKSDYKPGK
ncbi:carboxypeptidase-like regulatory domain-containing protein [Aureliella helgolandensis]|uniref:Carboxypeptidase regulatory-like domain-containing protein n=1 Tax=Aureliella helgolandensis TaxID=2527968 RepID=A0A518GGR3_9BACT|nr:carboxypeptidase-like regulatory domain-containing protein [Aureliella helgolandensis]QDV27763.1 hypothetical protein Q31a_61560 [Aureliella helgolandensis]